MAVTMHSIPPLPLIGDVLIRRLDGGATAPPGWTETRDHAGRRSCYRICTDPAQGQPGDAAITPPPISSAGTTA